MPCAWVVGQVELKKARQEKIMAEKAEKQKEWDLKRKQRKAEELDTQPYIAERRLGPPVGALGCFSMVC